MTSRGFERMVRVARTARMALLLVICWPAITYGSSLDEIRFVAEMEPPEGIAYQPVAQRSWSADPTARAAGANGIAVFERWVRANWLELRQVDCEAMSRYHREQTKGFVLPVEAGELVGEVLAFEQGDWHLQLRGSRLPARFDIVHRYLTFFAVWDPDTSELSDQTVSIRGWILE